MFNFWPLSHGTRPSSDHEPGYDDCIECEPDPPDTIRVRIGSHSTCVYGYPSSGGVLVLPHCNGVDLSFLGLPRFDSCDRSDDPEVEDRHCALMRKLGAWKFTSVGEYEFAELLQPDTLDRKKLVIAAWLQSGEGVWVLVTDRCEAGGKGVGSIWNAFSMDERCQEVEKFGGIFYQDPANCPDLEL
ncbi:uncharacterized protein GGS22DRAFT_162191 [Annulohypoxylon maeteangense]|uniref:uncharacterized protein n=1 Tax=Annulohypoxylon maeteangense TaxID=1927788 RepID=UPI002007EBD4|nr:uncharacterized protein GGS22DRAFT_162191 [Annulohypoxylon maeteangense]KAI0885877.1 hypothetical protein GGS22DRAFT_162191 [Annulohypoxylon maeteangense]